VEEGKKFDTKKPKAYLLPPKALMEVSRVLTIGAEKYDEENWRKLDNLQKRYTGAALRHLFAHMDGERLDPETNLSHIAHALCCLLFKLEIEIEETEKKGLRGFDGCEYSASTKRNAYAGLTDYEEGSMSDIENIL
tara:strand:+ start:394 stop:801 length:408 start_codon:yes stop_codon:yes gene_type:complete